MYAGAIREEVFSRPTVVRKIKEGFVPVALMVPRFQGRSQESRLATSIRVQKVPGFMGRQVPQGICVTNLEGKVLEWIHRFDVEKDFIDFLERNRKSFGKDPEGSGPMAVPRSHGKGEACRALRRGARGSLSGTVYGRGVNDDGKLCAEVKNQDRYIQEKISVRRGTARSLWKALRGAKGTKTRVPEEIVLELLREVYMGQKDLALLNNPLGGRTTVRELDLRAEKGAGGLFRLKGSTHLRSESKKRPVFRHDQEIEWRGFVETDEEGIIRLTLIGQGTYDLRWRGFEREEDRFRMLMAGRALETRSAVRFGLVLERREDGPDGEEEGALAVGPPPASLRSKMEKLGPRVRRFARSGGDMRQVAPRIRKLEELIRRRDFEAAERQIERVLESLRDG